tara:strand:- start:719 stop:1438 length:720 start_codon:yes stop_codon:yes gene_type:complete
MASPKFTHESRTDGFGAQYQEIIVCYVVCKEHNRDYVYTPFITMEHNYTNDPTYIEKKEELINLKNNIENNSEKAIVIPTGSLYRQFEDNIDFYLKSDYLLKLKNFYWANKSKNFFNNDKMNIAVHVRRMNVRDHRPQPTPDSYFIKIINEIRSKYKHKSLQFHIYSQGDRADYKIYENIDTMIYLDTSCEDTFQGLVAADILVTSPSSFSYAAALLSDGEIYYKTFWHKPASKWIIRT